MKAIHVIQNDPSLTPWPKERGSNTYESGFWKLTPKRARQAVGADMYFHSKQSEPSFFGGRITDYRIKTDPPWRDHIIFTLEASRHFKNKKTSRNGWSNEMKIVE